MQEDVQSMLVVAAAGAGQRLDQWLQHQMPQYSRSRLQAWIKAGRVRVNDMPAKASLVLRGGETVQVEPLPREPLRAFAEDLPVTVLYEDAGVVAIDKPAGMVVHAGAGRNRGTLVNALLHRFGTLSGEGGELRPGIVHRLDRETSGVLLVARTDAAHRHLAEQFRQRRVEKVYWALVQGSVARDSGRIDTPIGRHPVSRVRMKAGVEGGRPAHSEYRVLRRFPSCTLLEVRIHTGRTHQIRVHLASIGYPVAGDVLYGARSTAESQRAGRFFLHARRVSFESPETGERRVIEAPLPAELESWLAFLGGSL